jgi:hypothetical protein
MVLRRCIAVIISVIVLLSVGLGIQGKPVIAASNTYYVAKNGSDNNPGTQAQPWLTFQKATSTIVAGDTVYVRAGVYNERLNIVNKLGNTTQRITVKKYPNETVIIDGTGLSTQSPLFIQNSSYITVDGFEVRNSSQVGVSAVYGQNHYMELLNLNVHDCGSSGIMIGYGGSFGNVSHLLISGCSVYNVCQLGYGKSNEAFMIHSTDTFEIKNCVVHDTNSVSGLDIVAGSTNGNIHHNEIYRTNLYIDAFGYPTSNINVYDNYFHDIANNAIFLGCEKTPASVTNINIYNNLFYNNPNGCFVAYGEAGGFTKLNFKFINNTCYKNAQSGWNDITFGDATGNYQNCIIANNIIMPAVYNARPIVSQYPSLGGYIIDHNLFWSGEGSIYPESITVPRGSSAIAANPLLVNPPTDFSISANSPAKDAGSSTLTQTTDYIGTARPQGAGYDIGAYEIYTGTPAPPTTTTTTAAPGSLQTVLRPNANGDVIQLSSYTGNANYRNVMDTTSDEDTSFNYSYTGTPPVTKYDLYALSNHTTETGGISYIKVYARSKGSGSSNTVGVKIKIGGTEYTGSSVSLSNVYTNYSYTWNTNPKTGAAWTWSDIDALQAGVTFTQNSANTSSQCTQLYVEVRYSSTTTEIPPASTPRQTVIRPSDNGDVIQLKSYTGNANSRNVMDTTSDEETSFNYSYTEAPPVTKYDLYALSNHTTETGGINYIKVYARCGGSGSSNTVGVKIKIGGTEYTGSSVSLSNVYTNYSYTWNTNPKTGVAWTWSDIDALQAGVTFMQNSAYSSSQCTQLYVEVGYAS